MNIADELDRLFQAEPPLPAAEERLYAGRAALRQRRALGGVGVAAAAVVLGGTGWALVQPGEDAPQDVRVAADPTQDPATLTASIPLRDWSCADPCLGDTWSPLEEVPHDVRLDGVRTGQVHELGTPFLGWDDGRLVRYRDDFLVTGLVIDPFQAGATGTAGVEVEYEDTRHRVLMSDGFGFQATLVRPGSPDTLAAWVAATPTQGGCGGQLAEHPVSGKQVELPGCPRVVDGRALPPEGVTVVDTLTDTADLERLAHPGASVAAWLVESEGLRWYVVVEAVAGGRLYDGDFAPASETLSLHDWAVARLTDAPLEDGR